MRTCVLAALAAVGLLGSVETAHAQAGQFFSRAASRSATSATRGGHGVHVSPHGATHFFTSDMFWVVMAVVGVCAAAGGGMAVGAHLAGPIGNPPAGYCAHIPNPPARKPSGPSDELTVPPEVVEEKVLGTTRLLTALARSRPELDPDRLEEVVRDTFDRVQACWQARDYRPVYNRLDPPLLSAHVKLIAAMKADGEANRLDGLRLLHVRFAHLSIVADPPADEVTAVVTFVAASTVVNADTGEYLRGRQDVRRFQEFWTFRRDPAGWMLTAIDLNHQTHRLRAANRVDGMPETDLRNVQAGVVIAAG